MRLYPLIRKARGAFALMIVAQLWIAPAAAAGSACDSACLKDFTDRYLNALVAHDPSMVPLAKNVRLTENAQSLQVGKGLWKTASEDSSYRLYVPDPVSGQVAFLGSIKENGIPQILALRLKVRNRKIVEAETIIAREQREGRGNAYFNPDWFKKGALPIFSEVLQPAERRPREELLKIAGSYFEAIMKSDGGLAPFDDACERHENGVQVTNSPDDGHIEGESPLGCAAQLSQGATKTLESVRDRRYFVDEEHGLVFVNFVMESTGAVKSVTLANGRVLTMPPGGLFPIALHAGEIFKIKNGKIVQIEAVYIKLPYGVDTGWAK